MGFGSTLAKTRIIVHQFKFFNFELEKISLSLLYEITVILFSNDLNHFPSCHIRYGSSTLWPVKSGRQNKPAATGGWCVQICINLLAINSQAETDGKLELLVYCVVCGAVFSMDRMCWVLHIFLLRLVLKIIQMS